MKTDTIIFWVTLADQGAIETFVTGSPVLVNAKIAQWAGLSSDKSDAFQAFRDLSLKVATKTDGLVDAAYELIEVDVDFEQLVRDSAPAETLEQLDENDIIEFLEATEKYRVVETPNLYDQMKIEWLKKNWENISLEQLENLVK